MSNTVLLIFYASFASSILLFIIRQPKMDVDNTVDTLIRYENDYVPLTVERLADLMGQTEWRTRRCLEYMVKKGMVLASDKQMVVIDHTKGYVNFPDDFAEPKWVRCYRINPDFGKQPKTPPPFRKAAN